eukprot:EG_transcript_161
MATPLDRTLHSGRSVVELVSPRDAAGGGPRWNVLKYLRSPAAEVDPALVEREYRVLAALAGSPGVIAALALEPREGGPGLRLEYGGLSAAEWVLDYYTAHSGALPKDLFYKFAVQMCDAVSQVHLGGFLHGDVSMQNFLVEEVSRGVFTVRLCDFNHSCRLLDGRLHRRGIDRTDPRTVARTTPYTAPEVLGLVAGAVDHRSDLYSLGMAWFHLLYGRPLVQAADPALLVDLIEAMRVPDLSDLPGQYPLALCDIVTALLQRMPEARQYRSAFAVGNDLAEAATLAPTARIALAQKLNAPMTFHVSTKMYGRSSLVQQLQRCTQRMLASGFSFCTVHGPAGMGKTTVCQAALQAYLPGDCLYLYGAFEEPRLAVPYSALDAAFARLRKLDARRQRVICSEVARHRRLLTQAFPSLAALFKGPAPGPAPELLAGQRCARFALAVSDFFTALCEQEAPLVLVLDDAEWLDHDTAKLLRDVAAINIHMLVVLVYRDDICGDHCREPDHRGRQEEVAAELAAEMRRTLGDAFTAIHVPPLTATDIAGLVYDSLHCSFEECERVAAPLTAHTGGRPLFARHLLRALYHEGVIRFNPRTQCWGFRGDGSNLEAPREAVAFLRAGMERLPFAARQALGLAAALGRRFHLTQLALLSMDAKNLADALMWEYVEDLGHDMFQFAHELVRTAACALVPESDRQHACHRLAWAALGHGPADGPPSLTAVALANYGVRVIQNEDACDEDKVGRLFCMNVVAGDEAKAVAAHTYAVRCYEAAHALLPDDPWGSQYATTLALHLGWLECASLIDQRDRADQLYAAVQGAVQDLADRHRAVVLRLQVLAMAGRHADTVRIAALYLEDFGLFVNLHPPQSEIQAAVAETLGSELFQRPDSLLTMPDDPRKDTPLIMETLGILSAASHAAGNLALRTLVPTLAVQRIRQGGVSLAGCGLLAVLGFDLLSHARPAQSHAVAQRAFLMTSPDVPAVRGVAALHYGMCAVWGDSLSRCLQLYTEAFACFVEQYDILSATHAAIITLSGMIHTGEPLASVQSLYARTLRLVRQIDCALSLEVALAAAELVLNPLMLHDTPHRVMDAPDFETRQLPELQPFSQAKYLTCRLIQNFFARRHAECYRYAERGWALAEADSWTHSWFLYHIFASLALSNAVRFAVKANRDQLEAMQERLLAVLEDWATHAERTFEHVALLCRTHWRWAEQRSGLTILKDYETAATLAKRNGQPQFAGIALEYCGQLAEEYKLQLAAVGYYQMAGVEFQLWGADYKAEEMAHNCSRLAGESPFAATLAERSPVTTLTETLGDARAPTVVDLIPGGEFTRAEMQHKMRAALGLSRELEFEALQEKAVRTMLFNTDATRVVLLFPEGEDGTAFEVTCEARSEEGEVRFERFAGRHFTPAAAAAAAAVDGEPAFVLPVAVQGVWDSRSTFLLNEVGTDLRLASDAYITARRPRAILAAPVKERGEVHCIAYLESSKQSGVFTIARQLFLEMLTQQFVTCLVNSRRVQHLETSEMASRQFIPSPLLHVCGAATHVGLQLPLTRVVRCPLLYADLQWLRLGREMLPAATLFGLYERYVAVFAAACTEFRGVLVRQDGSALVLVFPEEPSDYHHALAHIQAGVAELNRSLSAADEPLRLQAAGHYGAVQVGLVNADQRTASAVLGLAVGEAALVAGFAAAIGRPALYTEALLQNWDDSVEARPPVRWMACVSAPGQAALTVGEVLTSAKEAAVREHELEEGIQAFAHRHWSVAKLFWFTRKLQHQEDRALAEVYQHALEVYSAYDLELDWGGQLLLGLDGALALPPPQHRSLPSAVPLPTTVQRQLAAAAAVGGLPGAPPLGADGEPRAGSAPEALGHGAAGPRADQPAWAVVKEAR